MDKFKIGPFRATALVAGNMIGSGILVAPALLAPYGQMSLIGWILTTIGALALSLVFSKLAIWIPNSGGPYTYVKHIFGDFVGFQMAWGYWISSWCGSVSLLVGTLQYISVFAPEFISNTAYSMAIGLGMIWLFTYFNIRGLKETTFVGIIVFLIKVVPLVLIAAVGIFYADFSRVFTFDKCDWSSLGSMAPVLLWAFIGLESATIPSEEVENPQKTIPVATIAGVMITAAVYILGAIVITGVLPHAELIKSAAPYVDSANKICGYPGYLFMIITGIIGLAGSLNGWILIQGQVPYAAAKEGLFPKIFLKTNKNRVPSGVVIGSVLMSIMFILTYQKSLVENLRLFIDIAVLAMLLPYFYSVIAYGYLAVMKKEELSKTEKIFMPIIGLVAFLYSFILIVGSGKELISLCFLIFLISVPFYCFIKKK
jgi:APA family basic amino acid/polyamine antiporter